MTENLLLSRVREYMNKENMPWPHFVALSGGPDSVCLLHTMLKMQATRIHNLPLVALHCNFHLRGEESDRDEQFCRDLCKMLDVHIVVKEFDTYAYMKEKGLSLEMAARELRYDWWKEVLYKEDIYIGVGHHADDSIETMLMNLMRGTGINGLTGIVPINKEKQVIRPLLCLNRTEVLQYLKEEVPCPPGWDCNYITDHTNDENDTLRNQIRNQLIPLMETMVPQARKGMVKTMKLMKQTSGYINYHIMLKATLGMSIQGDTDALYYTVDSTEFTEFEKNEILQFYKNDGYNVDTTNDTWVLTFDDFEIPTTHIPQHSSDIAPERFDADKVEQPIIWRHWRKGDRIDPLGMNGKTRKLSDLFTDAHYLPIQKQLAWVVTDAQDRILWVPGLKRCDFAKVTPDTKNVLEIEY